MPAQAQGQSNRKQGRRNSLTSSLEDGGGTFEVYQSAALTFQNTGQFQKAIDNYTKALELREGDKNCLVARSMCYLQLGDSDKALADAEATLTDDKNYIKGILQQAESYYQKGQFEFALMHYHRGYKLRPEVKAFRLGIQKSQEAIDNCIGEAAGIKLSKDGDLSYFFEEQQKAKAQQKRGGYGRPTSRQREQKKQRSGQSQNQKTVKQLLGELYADKEYLEDLLKETENAGNQSQTNSDVHNLAEDCLNYLDTRTQFWQQQKPMYTRKHEKKQRQKGKSDSQRRSDFGEWVLARLEEIDQAQADGRYEESLKIAKKTLKEVEKASDDDLPNRPEIVANLHSCLGNAYLELNNYSKALYHHGKDKEIADQHDLEDAKSRSCDNLGRVYARMGNYEGAIKVWEDKIPHSKSALESTWLYHEIGRCHLELGHYGQAKEYGEKSLEAATAASDDVWKLNATVLVAQCQVKLDDYEAALDSFERSLEMARLQDDKAAESAIVRAIEDVNDRIAESVKQGREQTEDQEVVDQDRESIKQEPEETSDKKSRASVGEDNEVVEDKKSDAGAVEGSETVEAFTRQNTQNIETQVQRDKKQEKVKRSVNQEKKITTSTQESATNGTKSKESATTKTNSQENKSSTSQNESAGESQNKSQREDSFWIQYNEAVDEKLRQQGISDPTRKERRHAHFEEQTQHRERKTSQYSYNENLQLSDERGDNQSKRSSSASSLSSSNRAGEYDLIEAAEQADKQNNNAPGSSEKGS